MWRRRSQRDFEDEIQSHIEIETDRLVAEGMRPDDARLAARRRFGNVGAAQERFHDARRLAGIEHVVADARHALRGLRKTPGFTALAVLTLAVGIGATTAIFSVVDGTLLAPLPFAEPQRLMSIFLRMPVATGGGEIDMSWSYPKYQALVRAQRGFDELSPRSTDAYSVGSPSGADVVPGESVGANYFHLLGVSPERGRFFSDEEDRPTGGDRVVVISDAFWRERFGASESAIGAQIEIAGAPYTVIGITPPRFAGLSGAARMWALLTAVRLPQVLAQANAHNFDVVARLAAGTSVAAAKTAVVDAGRAVDALYPDTQIGHWRAAVYSLNDLRVDPLVARSVLVLAAGVVLLLVIACVNVASLLLARGASRRRELAIRLAIGATGRRLASQLLTESAVLAALGVVAGLGLAIVGVRLLSAMAPLTASTFSSVRGSLTSVSLSLISVDARALAVCVVVATIAGLGAGLVPAFAAMRTPLADAMRQGASTQTGFAGLRRLSARGMLVTGEIALAVVLLVAAGLMTRSLSRLFDAPLGYRPDNLLTARVSLNAARLNVEQAGAIWNEVMQRVARIPGVTGVGVTSCAPVGDHCEGTDVSIVGEKAATHVSFHIVSPSYFSTLGVPLLRGRDFSNDDRRDARPVALINAAAARVIWKGRDPLTTPLDWGDHPMTIVGIVGDVRYEDVEHPAQPAIFLPTTQSTRRSSVVVARTAGDPAAFGAALQREIRALDRNHTITTVKTMRERLVDVSARSRFATRVLTVFAAIALLLAALGVYGIVSLAVAQRRRELAVRIALGASRASVLGLVARETVALVAVGATIGALIALLASRGHELTPLWGERR